MLIQLFYTIIHHLCVSIIKLQQCFQFDSRREHGRWVTHPHGHVSLSVWCVPDAMMMPGAFALVSSGVCWAYRNFWPKKRDMWSEHFGWNHWEPCYSWAERVSVDVCFLNDFFDKTEHYTMIITRNITLRSLVS